MKKRKWLGVLLGIAVIAIVCYLVFGVRNTKDASSSETSIEETDVSAQTESLQAETEKESKAIESDKKQTEAESETESESTVNTENGEGEVIPYVGDSSVNQVQGNGTDGTTDTEQAQTPATDAAAVMPGEIDNTGLVVEKLNAYDGVFVEDGSDDTVSGVAAILVKNNTGQVIQYAQLNFSVSDGTTVEFDFSNVPSGAEIMVFEQNRQSYNAGATYTLLSKTIAYMDSMSMMENKVGLVTNSDNSITVTNKTDSDMPSLRLFYKYRYDNGTYVGGITFTAKISDLKAGESMTVSPSHYDYKGSEIVMVGQYDE